MSLNLLPSRSISEVAVQYDICIHTFTVFFQSVCMFVCVSNNVHRSDLYTSVIINSQHQVCFSTVIRLTVMRKYTD